MKIAKRLVSKEFRNRLVAKFPNLKNKQSYWNFLGYLMFGTYRDESSGRLIISAEMIANLEGKSSDWMHNNYSAYPFLTKFSREIHPFTWSDWSHEAGRARVITALTWDEDVTAAIAAERQGLWEETGKVYLNNGSKFTKKKQSQIRLEERLGAISLMSQAGCEEARQLLELMNNQPSNLFGMKILENISSAFDVAKALPVEKSERQIDILNAVISQYQPFYKPTAGSPRIFAYNENLLGLQREVRKALTKGWLECDLKSAQLAICAKTWEVVRAQKFLREGGNIWDSLFEHFQIEKNESTKRIFKTGLYALMFGAQKKKMTEIFDPLGQDSLEKFLSHRIIKSMWRARRKQLSLIRKNKGAINYFGQFISLRNFSARSILSQLAQAYELALLYPVVKLAKSDIRFKITLWQHDGFSLHIAKPEDKENLVFNLKYVVMAKAQELGIKTELEME